MRCAWVQERLLLYLDGELPPREAAGLVRHLERCAACTAQAESLAERQAPGDTSLATAIEAPAALDARVMEAVRGLPAPRRPWGAPLQRGWLPRLAWVPAAVCLLMVGFYAGSWNAARTRPVDVEMRSALGL